MAVSKYFAVGRTAVLSQRLLSAETFNRLADCQDVEQAMIRRLRRNVEKTTE